MNIAVDTSALYALVDSSNEAHDQASSTWLSILDDADLIVASSLTVTETVALLHARFGTSVVRAFARDVLPILTIDWGDDEVFDASLNMMIETEGKSGPSLTDCANLETMGRLRINTIFAYDKHFERPGIIVLGSPGNDL